MAGIENHSTTNRTDLPRIGITMGDPAGIGPEIVVKALADDNIHSVCKPCIIGDHRFLQKEAEKHGLTVKFNIYDLKNLPDELKIGCDSAISGKASAEYIRKAVDLWRDGKIDAITTAPISKKAIALGGYNFPGHTEFLAELTGTKKFAMSFFAGNLRVVLLSTHISLSQAINSIKKESLIDLIIFASAKLTELLGRKVKIAVAGLNPHASEGGMFGTEERDEISPAIEECYDKFGIDVSGPYSPDTIFLRAYRGEFDSVVALYHDQATIPVKLISFGESVNVTLGLPVIRTSVDHGTAFDIAGKWIADASSMTAAIKLAAKLAVTK